VVWRDAAEATARALVCDHVDPAGALLLGAYRTEPGRTEQGRDDLGTYFLALTLAVLTDALPLTLL
jgi:hypothetical protein